MSSKLSADWTHLEVALHFLGYSDDDLALVRASSEVDRARAYIELMRGKRQSDSNVVASAADLTIQILPSAPPIVSSASGASSETNSLRTQLIDIGYDIVQIDKCITEGSCKNIDDAIAFITALQSEMEYQSPKSGWEECKSSAAPQSNESEVLTTLLAFGYPRESAIGAVEEGRCTDVPTAVAYIERRVREKRAAVIIPATLKRFKQDHCVALLNMGYDAGIIAEALDQSDNLQHALSFINGEGVVKCQICLGDFNVMNTYLIECRHAHHLCFSCVGLHVKNTLLNTDTQQMHITACPCRTAEDEACNYLLTKKEIDEVISIGEGADVGIFDSRTAAQLRKNAERVYLDKAKREMGCIRCPKCVGLEEGSGYWFVPPTRSPFTLKQLVQCPQCKTSFCAVCNTNPYHFHCSCEEVVPKSQNYLHWVTDGRREYATERAARDVAFRTQLEEYNRERAKHEAEVKAARDRIGELQQTEEWKRVNCRLCPSCKRTIQKLDGCDSMKCGQDYHGGNIQNGCGHNFNWSSAPAYIPQVGSAVRQPGDFTSQMPENAHLVKHEHAPGAPVLCDNCHHPVVGVRLKCLNCPSFSQCFDCSLGFTHCRNEHVFEILQVNEV